MRVRCVILVVVGLVLAAAAPALAWGAKEHIQMTRIAVSRLLAADDTPAAMKDWLRQAQPQLPDAAGERDYFLNARVGPVPRGVDGLAYWSVIPDLMVAQGRDRTVEPFGVAEGALHYVNLELLQADEGRRTYVGDLSNCPRLDDIPRDMNDPRWKRAGMLPFRVEQSHRVLTEMLRAGRLLDEPGRLPRDEHATRWAGMLAHYVQDGTQPHHATVDYRSASYLPRPPAAGASLRGPDVHADMEWRLGDDDTAEYPRLRETFWRLLEARLAADAEPIDFSDPWTSTLKASMDAYRGLPLIGAAARAAYLDADGRLRGFDADAFFGHKGRVGGEEMTLLELKARQTAIAIRRTQAAWLAAWRAAYQEREAQKDGRR